MAHSLPVSHHTSDIREHIVKARARLVNTLRIAHAGELAAMWAYRGHAHSVTAPAEQARIHDIDNEEHMHRQCVRAMLDQLGVSPSRFREIVFLLIGKTIALLCHLGGWFIPMYGAGRFERRNIVECEDAARYAAIAGYDHFVDDLLHMAEVE